jgi:transposase
MALVRWVGRAIGLDVHRDFCVVAICEDGKVRSAGRVPSTPEGLGALAESLLADGSGGVGVTGCGWEVARRLEPHVQPGDRGQPEMTPASRALAPRPTSATRGRWRACCEKGELDAVWMPDRCRILPRRLARREQLMRARTRSKNEIQAVLARRLQDKPPGSDLFGVKGRQWLAGLGAARRGTRVRRRGSAADRVHRHRDRRGRPADRAAGAGLAGDPGG